MLYADKDFIHEKFYAESVAPAEMDMLWSKGWRHFGKHFFRYNLGFFESDVRNVIPLRIRLSEFLLSKSQRRTLRTNSDLQTIIRPVEITDEISEMFDRHKRRFKHGIPDSIYDFLSDDPARAPCEAMEAAVYDGDRLMAISFFDVGAHALSAVYGMFEPQEARRGLGIFTMLKEIEHAVQNKKDFYYQGYCYEGSSFYDYKKRFRGIEVFDWNGSWEAFHESTESI